MRKILSVFFVCALVSGMLTGCKSIDSKGADKTVMLRLAHNHNEAHPTHKSLVEFSKEVEKKTNGAVKVQLYPNAQLGSEREVIEMTQTGAVDIAKVSASALESFSDVYSLFSLPYLFDTKDHFYEVMDSDIAKDIYQTTKSLGFIGLTYYDAGSRNFYTKNKPIMHPDDLQGLKIRVQPSATAIRMVELMGGAPTPMAYGEVYTALQSNVIDGTENNEMALTSSNHGEVAKEYSYTEHAMVPDILIMNLNKMNQLKKEQKNAVMEAAKTSTAFHKIVWAEETEKAVKKAKKMGVTFHKPDKAQFRKAVSPLHNQFANKKSTGTYYRNIRAKVKNLK
ncbi:TRAP transporter substrate-binding protein [Bacillus sp. z60-11]|uniref:TRAP transporter substrate-binding protein n=1 Tax=Bacillus sp. z60-11 TaxID=3377704 RepID=UPI00396C6D84